MAVAPEKKEEAERYARSLARRLAVIQPPRLNEAQWCKDAGVSPSFFSNLRGTPTKAPAVPSTFQLKAVVEAAGLTLAEFFAWEPGSRVVFAPSNERLEAAFRVALAELPKKALDQPPYLVQAVRGVLALPEARTASTPDAGGSESADREEGALPRVATKRR